MKKVDTEKELWDVLKQEYGFTLHKFQVPINSKEEFRRDFLPDFWLKFFPVKTVEKTSEDWLSTTINGNFYEVFISDIWYVTARKNGVEIFDKRRFENEELLKLLI